jgi:hypothetical protein
MPFRKINLLLSSGEEKERPTLLVPLEITKLNHYLEDILSFFYDLFRYENKWAGVQANLCLSQANLGLLQANLGLLQANLGLLQANLGLLQANLGLLLFVSKLKIL